MKSTYSPRSRLAALVVLAAAAMVLGACARATNVTIPLEYTPLVKSAPYCGKSVAVVAFDDVRGQTAIGDYKDTTRFYPSQSVSEYVSRALYDELSGSGCRVQYHEVEYDYPVDYTITGLVNRFYVDQTSAIDYNATMELVASLKQGDREVFRKRYSGAIKKKGTPSTYNHEVLVEELLQDLMGRMVPELISRME
jgi:uncharacterized lipoprotein YajG